MSAAPSWPSSQEREPVRVIVTGAARRVGRAVAEEFARRGATLLLTTRRSSVELQETVAQCQRLLAMAPRASSWPTTPASVETSILDLADPASVEAFVAAQAGAPWDVLVLNAASYGRSLAAAPLASASAPPVSESVAAARGARAEAIEHFSTNAASALALCTGLARSLASSERRGGGAIVALGDMHAMGRPVRGYAAYLMSKAALSQMVDSLAVELAPRVRVNAVHPGVVCWPPGTAGSTIAAYESRIPLGRSGSPEDAAGASVWLALDAPYLTGVHLRVDGGRWLR